MKSVLRVQGSTWRWPHGVVSLGEEFVQAMRSNAGLYGLGPEGVGKA